MLKLIFQYYSRRAIRYFVHNRFAKLFPVLVFFLLISVLAAGIYVFFLRGFQFISKYQFFKDAVLLYIYELFMLVTFILMFASALIAGIFGLFYGKDKVLWMASPKFETVPLIVFTRMFATSLWPLLVIALPALFAIKRVFALSAMGFIFSIFSFAVFVAAAVVWAMAVLLGFSWILYRLKKSLLNFKNLLAAVTAVFSIFLFLAWQHLKIIDLVNLFQAQNLDLKISDIMPIIWQFAIFPSHFSAMGLLGATEGDNSVVFINAVGLLVLLFAGAVLCYFAKRRYLEFWQIFQEGRVRGAIKIQIGSRSMISASGPVNAIFRKEAITFFRNTRGMMWLIFLLLVWFIQGGLSFVIRHQLFKERLNGEIIPSSVGILQFAVIIYFVSMFVLRFAFPSFSMEKRTAWLIKSAPVDLGKVFLAKMLFYVFLFSLLGVVFIILNASIVQLTLSVSAFLVATVIITTGAITIFGLGLGAMFPNFETDDPEILSTSLSGLIFIFGSLLYGAMGAFSLQRLFANASFPPFALFAVLSVVFASLFAIMPFRALRRMEF